MKIYWGSGGIAPHILKLVLDGDEWSLSHISHLPPGKKSPHTHWIGGWDGPRAGLVMVVKRKYPICTSARSWTLVIQPIA